ncbi:signal peptidase I [Thermospira aquatica]|uniref:Signal peptidase I n=1 Tax=Thermospira aquatica TaxID=2828656 RepID=A0AAX3BAG3_9SPIR|nr:signal peptidase I [Thermospira aquatica]URA09120.1 signal peptidase I [Thermospira aquatica]
MFSKKEKPKPQTMKEKILYNLKEIFEAYVIVLILRIFLLEAYQIPTQSMVPNLLVGDIFMVSKLGMGSYIPLVHGKIPGFRNPKKNDIVVFISPAWNSPGIWGEVVSLFSLSLINIDNTYDNPKNLVKRVVAEPGDRIAMSNSQLIINGKPVETTFVVMKNEKVMAPSKQVSYYDFNVYEESFGNERRIVQHLLGRYFLFNIPTFSEAMRYLTTDTIVTNFDAYRLVLLWHFPEVYIPKKGDVLDLTKTTGYEKYLYKLLVERESKGRVEIHEGKFFLNGVELTRWTVRDDYYLCMGDNRDLSEDGRYFGLVPRNNIFGQPLLRYFPFTRLGIWLFNETRRSILKREL